MKHAYVVTEKIPGIEKMPNVRDHDQSIYLKLQVNIQLNSWEKVGVGWLAWHFKENDI